MSKCLKGPARDISYSVLVGRDGERCAICRRTPEQTPEEFLEIDHVDGDPTHNELPNYRILCKACTVGEENRRRVGNVNGHHPAQVPGGCVCEKQRV